MVLVLGVIGLVSGASLAAMHLATRDRIARNVAAELESKVVTLFPGARVETRKLPDESALYEATDEKGKLAGYAFLAVGMGYQGEVKLVVAVTPDLKEMVGLAVMPTSETPGLGQRVEGAEFREQFTGLDVSAQVQLVKGGRSGKNQVSAITGATVSSTAVVETLNKRMAEIRKLLAEGK
jgi:electron transport complex protein RnfG